MFSGTKLGNKLESANRAMKNPHFNPAYLPKTSGSALPPPAAPPSALSSAATASATVAVLTPSFLLRILTYPCLTMSLKLEAMVGEAGSFLPGMKKFNRPTCSYRLGVVAAFESGCDAVVSNRRECEWRRSDLLLYRRSG